MTGAVRPVVEHSGLLYYFPQRPELEDPEPCRRSHSSYRPINLKHSSVWQKATTLLRLLFSRFPGCCVSRLCRLRIRTVLTNLFGTSETCARRVSSSGTVAPTIGVAHSRKITARANVSFMSEMTEAGYNKLYYPKGLTITKFINILCAPGQISLHAHQCIVVSSERYC